MQAEVTTNGVPLDEKQRRCMAILAAAAPTNDPTASAIQSAIVTAPSCRSEDELVEWVCRDYIASCSTTQLSGAPKLAGKTTSALCLSDAVARGEAFIGRPTKQGIVVYLTEQTTTASR